MRRSFTSLVLILLLLVLAACGDDGGGDVADTSSEESVDIVSRAAGTLGDPNLTVVVNELADGFGQLGRSEEQAIQGAADGDAVCDDRAGPRASPAASQVEVEVVAVVDGCLRISYDVANFRSLVADVQRLRGQDQVVAASPLLLEYRLNYQADSDPAETWTVDTLSGIEGLGLLLEQTAPTGRGVTVAVIDSGIDASHPALENVTVRRAPNSGVGDYAETGHGTIAASVMVAPFGAALRGIAPEIELLDVPADLCEPAVCGCDPCAPMTPAEAIRWATDNGADIISMSFGYLPAPKPAWWQILLDAGELSSTTETIEVALAYAYAHNIVMTAAAGNCADAVSSRCETNDQFEIPAGHGDVIGVAAMTVDEDGDPQRSWYSTRQPYVELAAPGDLVIDGPDGEKIEKSGTSYAAPFVTASLAVLIGDDGPLDGQPNAGTVARQILIDTAADLAPDGRDNSFGHGQLQLVDAIQAARSYAEANPTPTPVPDS